jgi:hypothetical protein
MLVSSGVSHAAQNERRKTKQATQPLKITDKHGQNGRGTKGDMKNE